MAARYLIRFDDICPTMNWTVWRDVEEALSLHGVNPILAVVPDNQDEALRVCAPNARFWDEVRAWQARGWTIGLHGYQHRYATRDAGLLGIRKASEFSGLSHAEQQAKLQSALSIFERESVVPEVWVAPSHSFDRGTLEALSALGIRRLSDGFSLYPHVDGCGMMWVPQQLWHFREMPFGLWTVCLHFNQWTAADIDRFRADLARIAAMAEDFPSIITKYGNRRRSASDLFVSWSYRLALKALR